MEDKKDKIPLKSILSFVLIVLLIIVPMLLSYMGVNITRKLVIVFWIILSLNFVFIIIITISRLSNDFLVIKYYNYIFWKMYNERLKLKESKNLIFCILDFYKSKGEELDFKYEVVRLQEITDTSYEVSSFPILTLFFTVLYALSMYDSYKNLNMISLSSDMIFIILNTVLLFTFIHIFTLTYLETKTSLAKLCLNIIEKYELGENKKNI